MKKLVFGLIATVVFGFMGYSQDMAYNNESEKEVNNNKIENKKQSDIKDHEALVGGFWSTPAIDAVRKPWWAIATVDAGGAVAGGIGCLQVTGGVAATNPAGWTATGICALVGGAAASVGYAVRAANPPVIIDITPSPTFPNPKNELDFVGLNHNKLVQDFIKSKIEFTGENFLKFVNENASKYGIHGKILITSKELDNQDLAIQNLLNNDEDVIDWAISKLPKDLDSSEVLSLLNLLKESSDSKIALDSIVKYENELLNDKNININSKVAMMGFLSTLRNSIVLWDN
jgi:hypothetical protein